MLSIPKVSVLIPTYNYAHFLADAIESVLAQTYTDFELIIVDNHSTDNTEEVVAPYLKDSRISFYKNDTNIGLVGNWNRCLDFARGEYIKFLCADDKLHPRLLETFVPVLDSEPGVTLVTANREGFGDKQEIRQVPLTGRQPGKEIIYATLKDVNWIGEPTAVMFRKSDVKKAGPFNYAYTWLPDWDMWLRLLTMGDCYIFPEVLSYIRKHAVQETKSIQKNAINYFEDYMLYKGLREKNVLGIDLKTIDIDKLVHQKAVNCAKAMYKALPKIYNKTNRKIFAKGFKIAFKENAVIAPLVHQLFF